MGNILQVHPVGNIREIRREWFSPINQAFLTNLRIVECGKDSSLKEAIYEIHEFILSEQQNRFGGQNNNYQICHIVIASEQDTESKVTDETWQNQVTKINTLIQDQTLKLIFISLDQSKREIRELQDIANQFGKQTYFNQSTINSLLGDTEKILEKQLRLLEYKGINDSGRGQLRPIVQRNKYIVLFTLDASEKMNQRNSWEQICNAVEMVVKNMQATDQILGTIFNEGTCQITDQEVIRWNQNMAIHKSYRIDTDFGKDYVCQIF